MLNSEIRDEIPGTPLPLPAPRVDALLTMSGPNWWLGTYPAYLKGFAHGHRYQHHLCANLGLPRNPFQPTMLWQHPSTW